MCGNGKMMKIWRHRESDACLQCHKKKEMAAHVPSFWDTTALKVFHDLVESIVEWIAKADIVPECTRL